MAITLKGTAGAWAAGTTGATPTIPSHASGDKIVVYIMAKPTSTGSPPTLGGVGGTWNLVASGHNGSGTAQAVDAGQTWHWAYEKTASSSSETFACSVTNGNVTECKADVFQRTSGSYTWDSVTGVNVADTTSASSFSLAGTLTVGSGDMISVGATLSGNNFLFGATWTLSATGMTFGTVTKSGTDGSTNNGNDLTVSACYGAITAGTSASVTVTAANTLTGAQVGGGVIVRLREIAPVPLVADAQASPSSVGDATTDISLDATGSTGTPEAYLWDQLCGPEGVILDATDPTTTYDATIASGGTTPTLIASASDIGFEATSNIGALGSTAGDVYVVFLAASDATPTPPSTDWVCIADTGPGVVNVRMWCYVKLAITSEPANAWTWSSSHWHDVSAQIWRGCNVPARGYVHALPSTAASIAILERKAKTNAKLLLAGYCSGSAGTTRAWSAGTNIHDLHSTGTSALLTTHESVSPGATGTRTFTVTPGNGYMQAISVLLEAV